jgi:ABC-type amino acid transport substrate-binding protein
MAEKDSEMKFMTILATLALFAAPVMAQSKCADRDKVIFALADKYSEAILYRSIAGNGAMVEIAVSDAGTYTVLITAASAPGIVCVVSSGTRWETVAQGEAM